MSLPPGFVVVLGDEIGHPMLFFSWPGTFRCNICDLLVHVNVSDRNVQIQSDSVQKQIQVNTMRS